MLDPIAWMSSPYSIQVSGVNLHGSRLKSRFISGIRSTMPKCL